jgi:hypothetical protein
MFCQLTGAILNKCVVQIKRHCAGRRFQRASKEFDEMVEKGGELSGKKINCYLTRAE